MPQTTALPDHHPLLPDPPHQPYPPLSTEIVAGITTFFTMSYIVIVNPSILATEGTGLPASGVLTATVFVCCTMSILMGVFARLPFGVAPGMGLNAFFAYTIILQGKVPWPTALGIVFWAGVLFLLVSATPLREQIAMAIPDGIRRATSAGIGLLLTFIGLQNAGFVGDNPATLVGVGAIDHRAILTIMAIGVIAWLSQRGNPLAYLTGITVVTVAAWIGGWVEPPRTWLSASMMLPNVPASVGWLPSKWWIASVSRSGMLSAAGLPAGSGLPPPSSFAWMSCTVTASKDRTSGSISGTASSWR